MNAPAASGPGRAHPFSTRGACPEHPPGGAQPTVGASVLRPHTTPISVIATTDLERLYQQLEHQQDCLARQALLIAALIEVWRAQRAGDLH